MRAVEPPPKGAEERPSLVEKGLPSLYSIIHTFICFASGILKIDDQAAPASRSEVVFSYQLARWGRVGGKANGSNSRFLTRGKKDERKNAYDQRKAAGMVSTPIKKWPDQPSCKDAWKSRTLPYLYRSRREA